jgi:phenylpropionate dioxygenase-like ring-hydroxylating dioxygenase large terminal subunit
MSLTIHDHTHTSRPHSFSKTRYTSASVLASEWQRVFCDTWLLAGVLADVRHAGDFFTFSIGPEQILVTRAADETLHAFYNVCQHRGLRLVHAPRGNSRFFRCAYHAWTYSNDGCLKALPHREQFLHGVPDAQRGLQPIHVDSWNGMVFVHLGARPPPLRTFLGDIVERLEPYRFGDMTLSEDQTCHLNCNWKAVIDNFGELYHVDFLHPQHRTMVDCCNDTVHLFDHGHTGVHVPGDTVNPRFPIPNAPTPILSARLREVGLDPADFNGRVLDIRGAIAARKRTMSGGDQNHYSMFTDEQLTDAWQYNLFPNVVLSFGADYLWIMRARPHPTDPGQCEFDKISLVRAPRDTANPKPPRPERDVFEYAAVLRGEKSMNITIDQDVELLKDVQSGMQSAGFDTVWLSEEEARVQHFHGEWDRLMAGATEGSA